MGTNAARITVTLIFAAFVLLNACNDTPDNTNTPDNTDDPERLQVYDEHGTPFNETCVLVGRPSKPGFVWELERDPNYIFTPHSSTRQYVGFYPWTVGKINRGKIAIGFPDEKLELSSDFEYSFTEGVRICMVYIERKDNSYREFDLRKKKSGDDMYAYDSNGVYIYYSSADFNRPHNGIALKAGWNFIEEIQNPNWFAGSAEPYNIIGSTSQDVHDFLEKGYRWRAILF